jgi:hypothetical protein
MSKQSLHAIAVAVGLALILAAGAFAAMKVHREGNLVVKEKGGISPTKLPRHAQAPISATIKGQIGTVDGSHPPALERVELDVGKTIQMHVEGLPVCRQGQLVGRSTSVAKKVCGGAIVGSGEGEAEVAFPEQKPFSAKGPVLVFNGGRRGGSTFLLGHFYAPVPAPTAIVVPVKVTQIHRGRFGMHAVIPVPAIAGGAGSVTGMNFTLKRRFAHEGRTESFLTASCPAGRYYTDGKVSFSDGTTVRIPNAFACTPNG